MHCYNQACINKPVYRLWDGDDHINVCADHLEEYERPQDEVEVIDD